jgi:PIN domain nuclease of toxin-antitoxin system
MDACAMIAFLRGEEGSEKVASLLSDAGNRCFAHAVNLCEVYYDFIRAADISTARSAMRDLTKVGIQTRHNMSRNFWQRIGELKGTIRHVSLADCFAVALSEQLNGPVVTSDHHEFDALADAGICRALFIR